MKKMIKPVGVYVTPKASVNEMLTEGVLCESNYGDLEGGSIIDGEGSFGDWN